MKIFFHTLFFFLLVTQISIAQWVQVGLSGESIQDIAVQNSTIFAVTNDRCNTFLQEICFGKVFRSVDNGANWTMIVDSNAVDLAISPTGKVFVTKADSVLWKVQLYSSLDNGNTWMLSSVDSIDGLRRNITVSPDGILFCGLELCFMFFGCADFFARSTDDGLSWTLIENGRRGGRLFDFRNQYTVTIGEYSGRGDIQEAPISLSSDSGNNWSDLGVITSEVHHALALFSNGNIIIGGPVIGPDGIFISDDTCYTWTQISSLESQVGLSWSSGSEEGIFIGTEDLGVFLFSDEGDSLGSRNDGLTNLNVHALTLDNNGYIYAGTDDGVWRRPLFEVIPVELTSFISTTYGSEVILNWSTATETNNSGFMIERKSPNSEYSEIGFVPGFGTTTEPKSYSYTDLKVSEGKYTYRLKQIDFDGSYEYSSEVKAEVSASMEFFLDQNYPNPFNPKTVISYQLPISGKVTINVYDILGNEAATLVDEYKTAGRNEVELNAVLLPSGVYFYQLRAGSFLQTKKMLIIK